MCVCVCHDEMQSGESKVPVDCFNCLLTCSFLHHPSILLPSLFHLISHSSSLFLLCHLSFISSLHGHPFDFIFPWHPSFTHLIQYKGVFQGFWSVRDICLSDFLLTNCPFHYWIWWFSHRVSVTEPNPAGVPHRTDAVWGKKEKIPEMY